MADGTGAVTLRPWRVDDAPALVAAWHDPAVIAGSSPPAHRSLADAERWIEGCAIREQRLLAIDRVIDVAGECVGEVGLSEIDQRRGAALIGWWIAAAHRGEGRASAGIAAMVDEVFAGGHAAQLSTVVAQIGADNPASIAAARRAGFSELRPPSAERVGVYVRRR